MAGEIKLVAVKMPKAVEGADIIDTACKANVDVIKNKWVKAGVHINALAETRLAKQN
jgi:ornithine cyclodeaminase/alanine dehydrogenase-like protein (mu-crystallin family)